MRGARIAREDVRKIVEKGATQPEPVIGSGKFFLPEKRRVVLKKEYQRTQEPKASETECDRAVQISLPMAEVLTSLEQGLGELVRKVGRMFIESVLESEVEQLAGPRSSRVPTRQAYRWGGGARLVPH
jgi:hypothetical protein